MLRSYATTQGKVIMRTLIILLICLSPSLAIAEPFFLSCARPAARALLFEIDVAKKTITRFHLGNRGNTRTSALEWRSHNQFVIYAYGPPEIGDKDISPHFPDESRNPWSDFTFPCIITAN